MLFAEQIQPILTAQCAYLGCHGREGMPLTLYALNYLRFRDPDGVLDSKRPLLDERMLSPAELDHNRLALSARIGTDPAGDRERVIQRLIPPEAGGLFHAGVVVYENTNDPELALIREFLGTVQ